MNVIEKEIREFVPGGCKVPCGAPGIDLSRSCRRPCASGNIYHDGEHRCDRCHGIRSTVKLSHDALDDIQQAGRNVEDNTTTIHLPTLDALVEYCRRLKTKVEGR